MNSNLLYKDGYEELIKAEEKLNIDLVKLVADTGIWANPKVFDLLKQ